MAKAKAEPQLVLRPSLEDFDRDAVEAFIEAVRAKRMVATLEYYENKNAKLSHASEKVQRKFWGQLEMLEKELLALERAEVKAQDRLNNINILKQELGMLVDQVTVDPNSEGE